MHEVANRTEAHLKAAVVDRLIAGPHAQGDAVLISEMVVANWSRRADIVLANGRLWGFEVKSDADSLTRLPGQLATFQTHFEKLVLVVAERFEKSVRAIAPEGVGIWVIDPQGNLVQRTAPRQVVLNRKAYISLMTVPDLRRLASAHGLAKAGGDRARLAREALGLPVEELARAARDAVKRRHRDRHVEFLRQRAALGTLAALASFRLSNGVQN